MGREVGARRGRLLRADDTGQDDTGQDDTRVMAQGGGTAEGGGQKTTRDAIVNESENGLGNARGTIAMARTSDLDSATSQFFINLADNSFLDVDGSYPPSYAVFGEVVSGMDVVDAMVAVSTDSNDKPATDIVIQDMERGQQSYPCARAGRRL